MELYVLYFTVLMQLKMQFTFFVSVVLRCSALRSYLCIGGFWQSHVGQLLKEDASSSTLLYVINFKL